MAQSIYLFLNLLVWVRFRNCPCVHERKLRLFLKTVFFKQSLVKIISVLQLCDLLMHKGVLLHVLTIVVLAEASCASARL
jgi:hypothetical protein